MNLDTMRPQNRNDSSFGKMHHKSSGGSAIHADKHHHHSHKGMAHRGADVPKHGVPSRSPQATSYPMHGVIANPMKPGHGIHGVPGIISSTTTGNEVRQRLMKGIIESCMYGGHSPDGPVHHAIGNDATAYNSGMVHIRGSSFK
jgi:hypothetical protein